MVRLVGDLAWGLETLTLYRMRPLKNSARNSRPILSPGPKVVSLNMIDCCSFLQCSFPLQIAGIFPDLFVKLAILDPLLALGAWVFLERKA